MQKKSYRFPEEDPCIVAEPAVAYRTTASKVSSSDRWNPNVPFVGTQEEWWEHFHRIEEGPFYTLEEANREFEEWKKDFLASRLR